jgi:hypothetical protein
MAFFGFGHAQENAFAFLILLALGQIAIRLRCLNFCLPIAFDDADRLLPIFALVGHARLKRKEWLLPSRAKIPRIPPKGAHVPRKSRSFNQPARLLLSSPALLSLVVAAL